MKPTNGQRQAAFMPIGEALVYAERCRGEHRLLEAEAVCREILKVRPNVPEAEHLLGVIAHQTGRLGEAIAHLQRATGLAPQAALFHANLGEMYRLAGRPKLAVAEARRALEIEPAMPAALSNLGVALYELRDYGEAATTQRKAIAAAPTFADAHSNLGNALHALRDFDGAMAAYRRAVELKPDYADAWANLGTTLHHAGSFDDAIVALRRAIASSPHHANARSGLGILLLMRGDLAEGWEQYEWRLRSSGRQGPRLLDRPWQGENLAGKHIYVQAEQGFGDSLQFARYLPLLAARAAAVTLRVQPPLVGLLRESLPGITVLGDRGDPAPYHCDASLLSLPFLFKTRLETVPAGIPYLRAPAQGTQRRIRRVARIEGCRIGLVWGGNPEHVNDHRRSIDPDQLAPLLAVAGASFASLQYGARAADLRRLKRDNSGIADLASDFGDFADTAAAVDALDLVITVDTSVAHLAGALGKPVWVLLPWVTDWRWMLHREDSPWYPTMRLFRQQRGGDWSSVIAHVTRELEAVVQGDRTRLMPFRAEGERRATRAAAILQAEAAPAIAPPTSPAETLPAGHAPILADRKHRDVHLTEEHACAVAAQSDNAEAVHMLGITAYRSGQLTEAIEHVRRAVAIAPSVARYQANLGEMFRLVGRLDEALVAGRRALELDPDDAGAHSNVGIVLFDQGKFEEALAHHDRAIAIDRGFAEAHSNRGNALQRLRRFAEAEQAYRRAIELQPTFADAWRNLGTCLRELKRPEDAESIYYKALELNPDNPDTLDNLALAVQDCDRFEEAADLLRRALVVAPRSDKLHVHYAAVMLNQKKVDDAAAAIERACALNPNNHDAVNVMGRVAFERGDLEAALALHRRALVLKPDLSDAYNNMGNVLKELGHLQGAHDAFLEALRLDPNVTGVYVNLADSRKFAPGDRHLATMEGLAAKVDGLSKTDRMQLDFALGKAHADLKDHARSFKHLLAGNAAKRTTIAYDEHAASVLFHRIAASFTHELINGKTGGGHPSTMPIFIIGMPRSGTTLVEQIIASHPAVHGAGELQTFNEVVLSVRGPAGNFLPYPDFVPALDARALQRIGAAYVAEVRKLAPGSERVTDKMPSNYYFAGLIRLALPGAKIIHTIRDPVDTCMSCFSKLFSAEQNHTYDLGELGRYYKRYEQLMAHWHRILPTGSIFDVRYEDVVADLETQARRIIAYCGLSWHHDCLLFHKTDRPVRTASATQVRQPIYDTAVGRWRGYEQHLGPLLDALGAR
jgi:tetratricopeptide (TPR) repeat protein